MSEHKIIGIDLAKSVFQVGGPNQADKTILNKQLVRRKFAIFLQQLAPCAIAMEACGSGHCWAGRFMAMGHTVQLVPVQHVKAFVRGNKNDRNDALALAANPHRAARQTQGDRRVGQPDRPYRLGHPYPRGNLSCIARVPGGGMINGFRLSCLPAQNPIPCSAFSRPGVANNHHHGCGDPRTTNVPRDKTTRQQEL